MVCPESYGARAEKVSNPLTKSLLRIIEQKQTNLCVSADLRTSSAILKLIPQIGPHICVLKIHANTLTDFSTDLIQELLEAKEKYNFLIFEDMKFNDIASIAADQYHGSRDQISTWADLVTVNVQSGPDIVTELQKSAQAIPSPRGILLVAQMSSRGSWFPSEFHAVTIDAASLAPDFVVGFVAQRRLESMNSDSLIFTPGVSLTSTSDMKGQQYSGPSDTIRRGADVIIVGRGIVQAEDPEAAAISYKEHAWQAYQDLLQN